MYRIQSLMPVLETALKCLVAFSAAGLLLTMTGQVLFRYVLKTSFMGAEEITTLFGLWLYFSGMALVSAQDRHIRGGFVLSLLSDRARMIMRMIFAIACAAICLYFFAISLEYIQFITNIGRKSTFLRLPSYLWFASLSVGLLLSAVVFVLNLLDQKWREAG